MAEEKFCKDCVHFEDAENRGRCIDREDAVGLVTGDVERLSAEFERNGAGTMTKLVSTYRPCGAEGRHWTVKHE